VLRISDVVAVDDVPIRSFLESETAHRVLAGKRFTAVVVCRRYWKHNLETVRRLGTKCGGAYIGGIHFHYQGGQVRSLLSLISYLGSGEYRERYLGIKIPPPTSRTPSSTRHASSQATSPTGSSRRGALPIP
jgi:hypothetical protein